jgi:hypothetical protein
MKSSILTILFFTHVNSVAASEYCQIKPIEDVKKVTINSKASYFFRVFPNDDKVSFASDGTNMILDLDSKAIAKLPGTYDPVPLGDKVMSVPSKTEGMGVLFDHGNSTREHGSFGHLPISKNEWRISIYR